MNGNKDIKPMSWARKSEKKRDSREGGHAMNREQRRQAMKAKTRTPAEQQFIALAEYPCILTWSNGERSKTTLSRAFYNEDSYKRYAEYQQSGKPYPVKIEAEAPADPQGASSMFKGDTASTDYALLEEMCRGFTTSLQKYLGIDIPDLMGAGAEE